MSSSDKVTRFENINITYDSYGEGKEALVFIHGFTCAASLWKGQSPLFASYRSIVVDLPGHGRSDAPTGIEYSLEYFANSVNAVLEAEKISRAVLVGHSLGGPISTMFLRLFPDKVAGIIYVDSFFQPPETYMTHAQRRQFSRQLVDNDFFGGLLHYFWTPRTTDEVKSTVTTCMMSAAKHVRCNANTTYAQPHAWRWDEIYNIPAVHIIPPFAERFIDQAWYRHLPKMEKLVWPDNGHFLFMEDPEKFNKDVDEWLKKEKLLQ